MIGNNEKEDDDDEEDEEESSRNERVCCRLHRSMQNAKLSSLCFRRQNRNKYQRKKDRSNAEQHNPTQPTASLALFIVFCTCNK